MPTEKDLFTEEQSMVSMSFGEHIEELRTRLILAIAGLFVGVILTFIPPLDLGKRIMTKMEEPAQAALTAFYKNQATERAAAAEKEQAIAPPVQARIPADLFVAELRKLGLQPKLDSKAEASLKDRTITFPISYYESGMITLVNRMMAEKSAIVSLAPLETMTIFFMVCLVAGLVLASPWVFYQLWAFIAAGLYRHERHYVTKFLPFSLGLFLSGVFLCFFGVLPLTLDFLLNFNVWLGIEPTLRLSDWMSFATILPLIFGLCFQTPLIMLFLTLIGVLSVEDFRAKRKMAILIMVIAGAVLTPGQDPFSMVLLALPMIILYEIGIVLISRRGAKPAPSYVD